MTPETMAILITIGALIGIIAKRVKWINNQAIPFVILVWQYIGALLDGAGYLPGSSDAAIKPIGYAVAGLLSVFEPFKVALVNTAINVFLHQVQKALRRLPWKYVTSGSVTR